MLLLRYRLYKGLQICKYLYFLLFYGICGVNGFVKVCVLLYVALIFKVFLHYLYAFYTTAIWWWKSFDTVIILVEFFSNITWKGKTMQLLLELYKLICWLLSNNLTMFIIRCWAWKIKTKWWCFDHKWLTDYSFMNKELNKHLLCCSQVVICCQILF